MLVKALRPQSGDILFSPGDIHFDHHDPQALELALRVADAVKVNTAILIGDTFESAGLSRHGRPARRFRFQRGTIAAEEKAARPYITHLRDLVRRNRGDVPGGLHVLTGNHEKWWEGVQDEYPGLLDTPWFELYHDLFDNWHVHAEHTALKLGPLLVCHGHRLRGALSRHSASAVLANYPGQNTLYGHTHRVDSDTSPSFKYGRPVDHGAWTIGHLRDIEDSIKDAFLGPLSERHRQGFALVYFQEVAREMRFKVELVSIDRDRRNRPFCVVQGKLYR